MTSPLLLNRKELAARIGISTSLLDNWRKDPTFPAPLARALMWNWAEVAAWLDAEPRCDEPFLASKGHQAKPAVRNRRSKHDAKDAA